MSPSVEKMQRQGRGFDPRQEHLGLFEKGPKNSDALFVKGPKNSSI